MRLSEGEKQLLGTIRIIELRPRDEETGEYILIDGTKINPTQETLLILGELHLGEKFADWTTAFESLLDKKFLQLENQTYILTNLGRTYADQVRKEMILQRFDDILARSGTSKAYSLFCERVYGKDLGQYNVTDMVQLEKLLEVLNLTVTNQVLELGCGIGKITEFISDVTGAHILGVDIATEAVQRAQERTQEKLSRLNFQIGDMNNLSLPLASVDTIIIIDAISFVDDLNSTIGQLKALLKPNGQMGIFYSQYCSASDSLDNLLPDNTKLAHALKSHELIFRTWEFTNNEHRIWIQQKQVAEELKEKFIVENNLDLCLELIDESENRLKFIEAGKGRRYLYHVQLA